jgi:predicted RNA-binding protein YlxR (DUF448 family)
MKQRKIPLRKCSGCGEMKPKGELIRVVKNKEGEVSLDLTSKKAGRGAYLCPSRDCFNMARKARRFEKAFSMQIPADVFEAMEEELKANE